MERLTTYARDFEYNLPMQYYEGRSLDNADALDFRFCFILIENGSGLLTINEKRYFYMAPCLICVNEREHIVIKKTDSLALKAFYFHPLIINCALDFVTTRQLPEDCSLTLLQDSYWNKFFVNRNDDYYGKISIGPMTSKKISILLYNIFKETQAQARENWPCRSRSFFLEALFILDNTFIEDNPFKEPYWEHVDDRLFSILIYLYNNYERKLTIDELTSVFSINRTTLSKMFQDNLGETFVTFLNKLRIAIASQLLRDTKLPVSEVMFKVGFNDNAHFLRTFKKLTSLSPSSYREKYCWM